MGAQNSGGGRYYHWPSPDRTTQQKFWAVTTIISKGIPKEALKWWAAKMTAEWSVDNLATISTMLAAPVVETFDPIHIDRVKELVRDDDTLEAEKLSLLIDLARQRAADPEALDNARQEAIDLAKGAHQRTTKRAALKGTHVHKAEEAYLLGKPYPGVPAIVRPQYDEFLRFLEEHRPIIEHTEAKVFNREAMYAGALDSTMLMPSLAQRLEEAELFTPTDDDPYPRVIVDTKTAGSGVYPEVALQQNAYARAEFIAGPEGSEWPMPDIHAACVLWLPAGGEYQLLPVRLGEDIYMAFLYAYEILRWFEITSKNAVGDPIPRPMLADPVAEYERLREKSVDELQRLAGARRLALLKDVLATFTADELALAIVWDRETPAEVERYAPTEPCPSCGWQVEKVRHRNAKTPKWRCINDACEGGGEKKGGGNYPWASWETDPFHPAGQTSHLQPIVKETAEPEPKAAATEDEQQASLPIEEEQKS